MPVRSDLYRYTQEISILQGNQIHVAGWKKDKMQQDEEHLKLLSIFHYVVGGLAALFACFPIFHLIMGIVFIVLSGWPRAPK